MAFAPTKRAVSSLKSDPGLVYEILTDYESYAEWLPGIAQSKSLAREGDLAIAEFELAEPKKERFVFECIHTRNKMVLWRIIEGKAPVTQAEWTIEPSSGGSQVRLRVTGRMHWSRFLGPYRRFLEPASSLKALKGHLASFVTESVGSSDSGERIIDLMETEDGLVCWIRGKKYILQEDTSAP